MLRMLIAWMSRLLVGLVLVFSGAYLLIYLYRWEWNRAIISGLFFVAAEVALATSMITRRLRAIEGRRAASPVRSEVLDRLRSTPADRPRPFDWLTDASRQGPAVFVPVLLGAGVVLSALAYVVERIAEATAGPLFDLRLARRLAAVAPPEGGLLADRPPAARADTVRRKRGDLLAGVIGAAALAVLIWMGVQMLGDLTQSRPDPADRPARTVAELQVSQRGTRQPAELAAEALWVACRSTLGSLDTTATTSVLGGDRVAIVLEPGIGRLATRRLTGCLSDLRVDLVRAEVVAVRHEQ